MYLHCVSRKILQSSSFSLLFIFSFKSANLRSKGKSLSSTSRIINYLSFVRSFLSILPKFEVNTMQITNQFFCTANTVNEQNLFLQNKSYFTSAEQGAAAIWNISNKKATTRHFYIQGKKFSPKKIECLNFLASQSQTIFLTKKVI